MTYKQMIQDVIRQGFSEDEAYAMTNEQLHEWTDKPSYEDIEGIPF